MKRGQPNRPGNRAREMQQKRERIARKVPSGLNDQEAWAWHAGDRETKRLMASTARIRNANDRAERRMREYDPEEGKEQYPLYIRFGGLPGGGRSFTAQRIAFRMGIPDYTDAAYAEEIGVSCFRARSLGEDPDEDRPGYEVLLENTAQAITLYGVLKAQRSAYLLTGEEVGTGADEEPLLEAAEIAARVGAEDLEVHGPGEPLYEAASAYEYIAEKAGEEFADLADSETVRAVAALGGELPILEKVLEHATGKDSRIHGPEHWQRVCATGLMLCERDERADPALVFLFAIFHDATRESDALDHGHGERGAELASKLLEGLIPADRLEVLKSACALHTVAQTSTNPTIGACWDADRLDLWRLGVEPDPALLSTNAACGLIERAKEMQEETYTWEGLVAWFAQRFASTELWQLDKEAEGGES